MRLKKVIDHCFKCDHSCVNWSADWRGDWTMHRLKDRRRFAEKLRGVGDMSSGVGKVEK